MPTPQTVKSPIARRFIFYIILFSSLITLIITAIQLYRDYNTDIGLIHSELEQINDVHLSSLSSALWTSNLKLLQTSIEGILKIRDVQYVEIRDEERLWVSTGKVKGNNNIQRSYPMFFKHRNKNINIGTLTVNVSLDGVYQRLLNKVGVILISNAIKTSLVALFLYFLFRRLVARHLTKISEYTKLHNTLSDNTLLRLDRKSERDDEFAVLVSSINNMHKRLQEQFSEISHQKQYLSQTLNSIGDAVITTDKNGNVTRLNPVAEDLTGWKNNEAQNVSLKTIFPIVHATTRQVIPNPVDKVLSTGETVYLSNHTTLISKDGTEYQIADSAAPIIDEGEILGMVLVFNDVTEQYHLRQALQESEKKLRLIHSQVPGIVYQFKIDAQGNRSLPYVSKAVEYYIGLKADAVMENAEKWFDMVHPDDFSSLEKSTTASLKNLTNWIWEGRFIRDDGKVIWLRGTAAPERLDDGSTLWNGLFIDMTDRRSQEEQLRRSQKMDALGKLTGGIAHDYNNILGIVQGYAAQINEHVDNADKVKQYAHTIEKAAERGAELAKKLLSFSQNKQPVISDVNINDLLLEDKHMLEKTLTANHKLVFNLEKDLWQVALDAGDLEDAIVNMCINAQHAMTSGGQLTISTSNTSLDMHDTQSLNIAAGDYVLLSITDTGSGMDKDTKERIFDPFFSTKGKRGTGLGLSQVYGFVERSGGAINVYSEKDHGSRFTLYFPRSTHQLTSTSDKHTSTEPDTAFNGNETLLIVDDEQAMVTLAKEIFSARGYTVLTANDGVQALSVLDKLATENKRVDLIITDVIMPNMDGYQLAAKVQQRYPDIKLQVVSGFADNRHIEMINEDLHKNMLHKPYASNTLLKRVRTLLDDKLSTNILANRTVLTLDDDEDIQTLYKINLHKLGCKAITCFSGKEAIDIYRQALSSSHAIDIVIVDLSMPGDLGGIEVTAQIRKMHPAAKIIVASGHSEGPEMTSPQNFGFDAALEKNFNLSNIKRTLEQVLTP